MAPLSLSCFPSLAVFLFELLALNCVHNFLISYSLPLLTSSSLSTLLSPCFYLLINYILSFKTITMMKDPRCENSRHWFPIYLSLPSSPPTPGLFNSSRSPTEQQRSSLAGEYLCCASWWKSDDGCEKGPVPLAKLLWEAVILQLEQGEGWLRSAFHPAIAKCSAVIGKLLYLCDTDGEVETNHWVL